MNLSKLIVAAAIVVTLLSSQMGCSNNSLSNYTTYTDETNSFSLSYPKRWEPVSDMNIKTIKEKIIENLAADFPVEETSLLYMATFKNTTGYSGVNIVVGPRPSEVYDIEQVVNREILVLKQQDPDYQEISRDLTKVSGKVAMLIEYRFHNSSTNGLFHNLALVVLSGENIWTLTCSATEEIFSQRLDDFTNITRSFRINN